MNYKYLILFFLYLNLVGCSGELNPKVRRYFPDKDVRALAVAAISGDTNKIDEVLSRGVDVNSVGEDGCTPLAWTYMNGNKIGFEHLLKRGGNPNERYGERDTLLFFSIKHDDTFFLDTALKYGGDPNQRKKWGNWGDGEISLLRYTIMTPVPKPDRVRILIKHGADLHGRDKDVVSLCAMMNDYENVYTFLQAGASFSTNREPSSLLYCIEDRAVHSDDPRHEWLNKVVGFLKDKEIEVTPKEWKRKDQPKIINVITE